MPRFATRPALGFLGAAALLSLAACAPTATVSVAPTATTPPAPSATPTLVPAPTPTNVQTGWQVLDTPHFSLANPEGWTVETRPPDDEFPFTGYLFVLPSGRASAVEVWCSRRHKARI